MSLIQLLLKIQLHFFARLILLPPFPNKIVLKGIQLVLKFDLSVAGLAPLYCTLGSALFGFKFDLQGTDLSL